MTRNILRWALIPAAAFSLAACTVEKTQEGQMPDVKVEGGALPKYDVDPAKVEVKSEEKVVTVPDVDVSVNSTTTTIAVPDIDVKPANQ